MTSSTLFKMLSPRENCNTTFTMLWLDDYCVNIEMMLCFFLLKVWNYYNVNMDRVP
jgi:hypothetical protein